MPYFVPAQINIKPNPDQAKEIGAVMQALEPLQPKLTAQQALLFAARVCSRMPPDQIRNLLFQKHETNNNSN